ncbi:MAG: hypothetical protein IT380_12520 [Myxococcales bacterium]|nr:hypothetical protein [Myxococcales bacterium]
MSRWRWLGVGLGVLLAAVAVYALHDEEAPPPPARSSPAVPPPPPGTEQPPSALGDIARQAAPVGDPSPTPGPAPDGAASAPGAPEELTAPPPPMADSPFETEDSRELDYAFELVFGPDSGVDTAKAAVEVFQRCLEAAPKNRRCYDGLVAAQRRQLPGWTPPPPPEALAPRILSPSQPSSPLPATADPQKGAVKPRLAEPRKKTP